MMIRNTADTVVPIIPPVSWNQSILLLNAVAVAAIATVARTTIVECPSENHVPTLQGFYPVASSYV
jgi:hypothetical protein